jgi:hypothetical protein
VDRCERGGSNPRSGWRPGVRENPLENNARIEKNARKPGEQRSKEMTPDTHRPSSPFQGSRGNVVVRSTGSRTPPWGYSGIPSGLATKTARSSLWKKLSLYVMTDSFELRSILHSIISSRMRIQGTPASYEPSEISRALEHHATMYECPTGYEEHGSRG